MTADIPIPHGVYKRYSVNDVIHILLYPTIYVNVNVYCSSTKMIVITMKGCWAGQHIGYEIQYLKRITKPSIEIIEIIPKKSRDGTIVLCAQLQKNIDYHEKSP